MLNLDTAANILNGNLSSFSGYIYEEIALDALVKAGYERYFYDDNGSKLDFIIPSVDGPLILEVKMNKGNSKSAKAVIQGYSKKHAERCYKITESNLSKGSYFYGLPHYALPFLLEYLFNETKNSLKIK